jgi:Fe-S cluster assembly ATP-binding protein
VANGVNTVARESGMGVLIITHYQRILHLVQPERVSILFEGRIVHEGGPELVTRLEAEGYAWVERQVAGTSA